MMGAMTFGTFDPLTDKDFLRLAELIEGHSGIRMPDIKRSMVEGRLRKRVRDLGLGGLAEYCRFIFDEGGLITEFVHLIDAVTTNKTEFFREPFHFEFLVDVIVPEALRDHGREGVKVWSAACSIGAEPYTIAMLLDDFSRRIQSFHFEIIATDISTEVLRKAVDGVYDQDMVAPIPSEMQRRYLMHSRDRSRRKVRIVPELRRQVRFGHLNLMDSSYPLPTDMDVIFCRNILIYFNRETQQKVLERLSRHIRPGGYLILGHSETLTGMALPLRPVGPTIFRSE